MADIRTTAQLDDFVGSNEDPLSHGGLWGVADSVNAPDSLQRESNRARGHTAFPKVFWSRYWTPSSFDGDMEMWAVLDLALSNSDWAGLGFLTDMGGAGVQGSGYIAYTRNNGGSADAEIYRYDSSFPFSGTKLGSTVTVTNYTTLGTILLFKIEGTHLKYYYSNDGGANWTNLQDIVDNTYRTDLWMNLNLTGMTGFNTGYMGFGGGNPIKFKPQIMRY